MELKSQHENWAHEVTGKLHVLQKECERQNRDQNEGKQNFRSLQQYIITRDEHWDTVYRGIAQYIAQVEQKYVHVVEHISAMEGHLGKIEQQRETRRHRSKSSPAGGVPVEKEPPLVELPSHSLPLKQVGVLTVNGHPAETVGLITPAMLQASASAEEGMGKTGHPGPPSSAQRWPMGLHPPYTGGRGKGMPVAEQAIRPSQTVVSRATMPGQSADLVGSGPQPMPTGCPPTSRTHEGPSTSEPSGVTAALPRLPTAPPHSHATHPGPDHAGPSYGLSGNLPPKPTDPPKGTEGNPGQSNDTTPGGITLQALQDCVAQILKDQGVATEGKPPLEEQSKATSSQAGGIRFHRKKEPGAVGTDQTGPKSDKEKGGAAPNPSGASMVYNPLASQLWNQIRKPTLFEDRSDQWDQFNREWKRYESLTGSTGCPMPDAIKLEVLKTQVGPISQLVIQKMEEENPQQPFSNYYEALAKTHSRDATEQARLAWHQVELRLGDHKVLTLPAFRKYMGEFLVRRNRTNWTPTEEYNLIFKALPEHWGTKVKEEEHRRSRSKLWVKITNIPTEVSTTELREACAAEGITIKEVKNTDGGYLVRVGTEDAKSAILALNGVELMGKNIKIGTTQIKMTGEDIFAFIEEKLQITEEARELSRLKGDSRPDIRVRVHEVDSTPAPPLPPLSVPAAPLGLLPPPINPVLVQPPGGDSSLRPLYKANGLLQFG